MRALVVTTALGLGLAVLTAPEPACAKEGCHEETEETGLLQLGKQTVTTNSAVSTDGCTGSGLDPYVSGALVDCCDGLSQCLSNWDGDRWYYKCYAASAPAAKGAACEARPAPASPPPPPHEHILPAKYYPHFDTTPDYLKISSRAKGVGSNGGTISDNYYLVIGDQGGTGGCGQCGQTQIAVAKLMKEYVATRKSENANSTLLFVLAVGDNFYWTGAGPGSFDVTWKQIYGELADVPWFPVMGNHDYGNTDPGAACAWKNPRFSCDAQNWNTTACGGPQPYSNESQAYASNQLNVDKGGVDGDIRKNYQMPDYMYYYTIPGLDFELLAMDWNAFDLGGLGGDGPERSASACQAYCGSYDGLQQSMNIIKQASTDLLNERASGSNARNVAIIGHYPNWSQGGYDFRDMFIAASPLRRKNRTKVFNFFGHAHTQVCFTVVDGECVNFQTGGGGGCCGLGDVPAGFVALSWGEDKLQKTECFAPDARCTLMHLDARGFEPESKADVCDHTIDEPKCPKYQYPERKGSGAVSQ